MENVEHGEKGEMRRGQRTQKTEKMQTEWRQHGKQREQAPYSCVFLIGHHPFSLIFQFEAIGFS